VVARGETRTGATRDFTVKVDVTGLSLSSTYYYRFEALGAQSVVGRTRTLPAARAGRLRLALASCSNYPHGNFPRRSILGQAQEGWLEGGLT
jgi:phosphodiesterase/alkaline phosphatase D-like protein